MSAFVPAVPLTFRRRSTATTPHAPRHRFTTSAVIQPPDTGTPDSTRLKNEHLEAYFDANDSTYQTRLRSPFTLAMQNFVTELGELLLSFRRAVHLEPPTKYTPPDCLNLELSNEAVANREREREFRDGEIEASSFVRVVYDVTCGLLDMRFDGRPIARFWFLETVARMPYFAYTSCLHLLATLGWYRSPTLMNMHHAEELNEAYHLAVMEALGGDRRWGDRFLAFHASILYYWFLVFLFFVSPAESYRFSQLIESHAVDTYAEFLEANADTLRELPAPDVAHDYYANYMYYFYEFQLSAHQQPEDGGRRPSIDSLYDVFQNIQLDEREHTRTMAACTDYIDNGDTIWYNGKSVSGTARRQTLIPTAKRQDFWRKWSRIHEQKNGD